jgi:hypothetical protein
MQGAIWPRAAVIDQGERQQASHLGGVVGLPRKPPQIFSVKICT